MILDYDTSRFEKLVKLVSSEMDRASGSRRRPISRRCLACSPVYFGDYT